MSLSNKPQVSNGSVFTKTPTFNTNHVAPHAANTVGTPKRSALVLGLSLLSVLSISTNIAQFISYNKTPEKYLEKLGKVIEKQEQAGAIGYLLELPTGEKTVVYGAKGTKALFYGDAYQADTQDIMFSNINSKATVSNPANPADNAQATEATEQSTAEATASTSPYAEYGQNDMTPGQAIGEYKGKVPEIFPILDALAGYKEDASISPANTIYVLYDPRCPYCHQLFEDLRKIDLKAKNATVKWLPTTALGEDETALAQAVAATHAKSVDEFAATLGKNGQKVDKVTEKESQTIKDNQSIFSEAHKTAFAGKSTTPSVPAVFFLDKRTGKPRFIYGSSIPEIRKTIFGE